MKNKTSTVHIQASGTLLLPPTKIMRKIKEVVYISRNAKNKRNTKIDAIIKFPSLELEISHWDKCGMGTRVDFFIRVKL